MFDFGLRLRELREKHKLSQEQLGRRVDRSKSVISSYENNLKMPPLSILTDFAVIFNVSLDYLAGLTDTVRTLNVHNTYTAKLDKVADKFG